MNSKDLFKSLTNNKSALISKNNDKQYGFHSNYINFSRSNTRTNPKFDLPRSTTFQSKINTEITFSNREKSTVDNIQNITKVRNSIIANIGDEKLRNKPDFLRSGTYSLNERIQLRKIKNSVVKTLINKDSSKKIIREMQIHKEPEKV